MPDLYAAIIVGFANHRLEQIVSLAHRGFRCQWPSVLGFQGYEDWQIVAVSQDDDLLKRMVRIHDDRPLQVRHSGQRENLFRTAPSIAKIEWKRKKSTEAPFSVRNPGRVADVLPDLRKDSKKIRHEGWAYAVFDYDRVTDCSFRQGRVRSIAGSRAHASGEQGLHLTAYGKR